MNLNEIREEDYALQNWNNFRPFFCRMAPEYIWNEVRGSIIEGVTRDLEADKSNDFKFPPFFVYPTLERLKSLHSGGGFFSEILELTGFRAVEALNLLAGMIRLESRGTTLDLLEDCFQNLWKEFSKYGYGHGIEMYMNREDLVLRLGSNNVFELVEDKTWENSIREYFVTKNKVTQKNKTYKSLMKILGGSYEESTDDDFIVKGIMDLNTVPFEKINDFLNSLNWKHYYWEERSLTNIYPPHPIIYQLRSPYNVPFHLLRVECDNFWKLEPSDLDSPFNRIALHLFLTLNLRTKILSKMGCDNPFTIEQAAHVCNIDTYSVVMTLGQMIKVGLAGFDKDSGEPWNSMNQHFTCKTNNLLSR